MSITGKNRVLRGLALLLLACAVIASLSSCGSKRSVGEQFRSFTEAYGELPSGKLYSTSVPSEQDGALSEEMLKNLYVGDGAISSYFDEGGVYLAESIDTFAEVGIFRCASHSDAVAASKICLERIAAVERMAKGYDTDAVKRALDGAYVKIYGSFCVYSIVEENDKSLRCFDRIF